MELHLSGSGPSRSGELGTVVFIHGFPFRGSMWDPQLTGMPEGWTGLAPDLRGFGDTDLHALPGEVPTGRRIGCGIALPAEPVLTMRRLADDVAELIRSRVDGPAVLCGLSMGGYVALELWRNEPELVRALILADTRAGADDDEGRENRLRTAQKVRQAGATPVADGMAPVLLANATRRRSPETVRLVRDMIMETRPATLIAALAGMATRHDSTDELPTITVPTLVLVGEDDALTPPEVGRAMADDIPDASFHVIPDSGHLPNLENPAAFNAALTDFLSTL